MIIKPSFYWGRVDGFMLTPTFGDKYNSMCRHVNLNVIFASATEELFLKREDIDGGIRLTLKAGRETPKLDRHEVLLYDLSTKEQIARGPFTGKDTSSRTIEYTNEQLTGHERYAILLVNPE